MCRRELSGIQHAALDTPHQMQAGSWQSCTTRHRSRFLWQLLTWPFLVCHQLLACTACALTETTELCRRCLSPEANSRGSRFDEQLTAERSAGNWRISCAGASGLLRGPLTGWAWLASIAAAS